MSYRVSILIPLPFHSYFVPLGIVVIPVSTAVVDTHTSLNIILIVGSGNVQTFECRQEYVTHRLISVYCERKAKTVPRKISIRLLAWLFDPPNSRLPGLQVIIQGPIHLDNSAKYWICPPPPVGLGAPSKIPTSMSSSWLLIRTFRVSISH